jgi:imidazolonepropionase-like amidohydrolase
LRLRAIAVISFYLLAALRAWSDTSSQVAITHVTVLDVRDGSAKADMTVLILGNRISVVASSKNTPLPQQVIVINGQGEFLIPGLWDMHIHTDGDARPLRLLLAAGITGVRDMGGDVAKLAESRRRIVAGDLLSPRLLFAGPMLKGPPAQADSDVWVIHSPDEARRAVTSLANLHVDFIKVHDGLARDSFLAIAEAAKARGLPFAGHVPASITPLEASNLGQRSIEHLEFLPKPCMVLFDPEARAAHTVAPGCEPESLDALLHRFAVNGTWLCPTIQSFRYFAPTQWNAIFAGFLEVARHLRQNHVPILAGTDWSSFLEEKGASPGGSLHDELRLLVEAGFTPQEVLRAATLSPAVFLGLSDSLGTVEAGKIADLVLLEANPLLDIHNTNRIVAVISKGRVLDRKALDTMRAPAAANVPIPSNH